MRILILISGGFVLLCFTSCKSNEKYGCIYTNLEKISSVQNTLNDTSEIIRLTLDSAFYQSSLPDISSLTRNNPFGDTIIIQFDDVLKGHLPAGRKIKILTQDEICSQATKCRNDSLENFSFLEIKIQKTDSAYTTYLTNTCVMPLYAKNGEKRFKDGFKKQYKSFKCIYGMMCGGGISMSFIKDGNIMKGKKGGSWSD